MGDEQPALGQIKQVRELVGLGRVEVDVVTEITEAGLR